MPILLSNEDVERLLSPGECVRALEIAYRELGEQKAGIRPRTDLYTSTSESGAFYRLRTMEGVSTELQVAAIRIGSDVIRWTEVDGDVLQEHVPAAKDRRYVGLVIVFDTNTSEPLLIVPDGALQRMRVGATTALAAKHLARSNSTTVCILGSGNQARGALSAMATVFPLKEVRIYSPRAERREAFARAMRELLQCDVHPIANPEQAVRGADIVACTTNSLTPVLHGEWLEPGMHVTTIEWCELADSVYPRVDLLAVHLRNGEVLNFIGGVDPSAITGLHKHDLEEWMRDLPGLAEILAGKTGRSNDEQITCFVNNVGSGLQFAATGKRLYELALEQRVGRELPLEWFLQTIPS